MSSWASSSTDALATSLGPPPRMRLIPRRRRRSSVTDSYTSVHVLLVVDFDRVSFRVVWLVMLFLRLVCILFLSWTARLYWFVAHPYMGYYASLLGPAAVANFKPMGVCFALVAFLHITQVIKMLHYSFHYKTLVLGPPPHSLGPVAPQRFTDWSKRFRAGPKRFLKTLKRDFSRLFFDRHGPFGVESRYFYLRVLLNEVVEIASQTTQVYKASVLVSKVWMNNLYVVVTVLNCWSTPLVRVVFRNHSPALQRLLCLVFDFLLDAATAVVIPLLIFVPYYRRFNFDVYNFEISYLYDDIWFANMVMENQQLFALTKWDFVWKMVPHLSIYGSLNSIRALVRHRRAAPSRVYCAPPQPDTQPSTHNDADDDNAFEKNAVSNRVSKPPAPLIVAIPEGKSLGRDLVAQGIKRTLSFLVREDPRVSEIPKARRLLLLIKGVLFVWGIALLGLHLSATWSAQTTRLASCATRSRPWFAKKISCSVVRHNCHMHGSTTVTDNDLAMIEPDSVAAIVFSHCQQLVMPAKIRDFRNLLGLDTYNSTLVDWGVNAAVTADSHPRITYIIFIRVNMTRLPDGILQPPLPPTMTDFEISVSNLTYLPLDLHERWHPMSIFYVEHAQLTAFPPTLLQLAIEDVSLIGNHITELPDFPPSVAFYTLSMTHTPLVRLPESIGDTSTIGFMAFGYTKIERLPAWMNIVAKTATKVFLHHTPFCDSKSQEEIEESFGIDAVLCCVDRDDVRQDGQYPLVIMAPRRPYDEENFLPDVGTEVSESNTGDMAPGP